MSFDLTNKNISHTFQNLLQRTGSDNQLYDLEGNAIDDLKISGSLYAQSYIVSSSVIVKSVVHNSGSTTFGDTADDTHQFTGSLDISGSVKISGSLMGLGTANPVFSSGNGLMISDSTQANLRLADGTDYTDVANQAGDLYLINRKSTGDIKFRVNTSTEAMTIIQSGHIGIGTTNPTFKLEIHDASEPLLLSGSADIKFRMDKAGSGKYDIVNEGNRLTIQEGGQKYFGVGADGGVVVASSSAYYTADTDNDKLLVEGKVGIGTNAPTRHLHLHSGSSGNVYFKMSNSTSGTTAGSDGFDFAYNGLNMAMINRENGFISFETNNTERVRILNDGNVGIRTSNPTKELTVEGSISASGDYYLGGGDVFTPGNMYLRPQSRVYIGASGDGANLYQYSTNNDGVNSYFDFNSNYYRIVTTATKGIKLNDDTTITGNLTGSGASFSENVGIKTTKPSASLHIKKSYAGAYTINSQADALFIEGSTSTGISIATPDAQQGSIFWGSPSRIVGARMGWKYDDLLFKFGTATANADIAITAGNESEKIRILDSGNVGIGTTSPTARLVVVGDGSTSAISASHNYYKFFEMDRTSNGSISKTYSLGVSYNNEGEFAFLGSAGSDFVVRGDGNVGIGTDSPTKELTVEGSISASGDIITTGDIVAQNYITRTTVSNITQSFSSGSTIFGDTVASDTHQLSGSVLITGSLGIGITSPVVNLDVSTADDYLARFKSSDNKAYISIQDNDTKAYLSAENSTLSLGGFTGTNNNNLNIITSSGYVGIGTNAPTTALQVVGIIHTKATDASNNTFYGNDVNGSYARTFTIDKYTWRNTGGNIKMMFSASNLGIGTTTPGSTLTVAGDISSSDHTYMTNNKSIAWPYLGVDSTIRAEAGHLKYTTSHGDHIFRSGSTDLVIFDASTQNVGIGTTTPQQMLHVSGGGVRISPIHGNVASLQLEDTRASYIGQIAQRSDGRISITTRTGTYGSNGIEILDTGKVGIGVESPAGRLEVRGTGTAEYFGIFSASSGASSYKFYQDSNNHLALYGRNSSGTNNIVIATSGTSYFNAGNVLIGGTSNNGVDGLQVNDSVYVATHITASGDISSSGILYGTDVYLGDDAEIRTTLGHLTIRPEEDLRLGTVSTDNILMGRLDAGVTTIQSKKGLLVSGSGHITASGNISSSASGSFRAVHILDTTSTSIGQKFHVGRSMTAGLSISDTDTTAFISAIQDENEAGYGNLTLQADDAGDNDGYISFNGQNGGERMRIIDSGNVGIGTTTPAKELTVAGDISASGIVKAEHLHSTDDALIDDNLRVASRASIGTEDLATNIALTVDGHISASGKIYEGPSYLQVKTAGNDMRFQHEGNGDIIMYSGRSLLYQGSGNVTKVKFTEDGDVITSGNIFASGSGGLDGHITASGKISLGDGGGSSARLHIDVDTEDNQPALLIEKVSDQNETALVVNHSTSATDRGIADFQNSVGSKLYIRGDGHVGIGTTSPGYELSIRKSGSTASAKNPIIELQTITASISDGEVIGGISANTASGHFSAGINFIHHDSNDGEIRFRQKVAGTNTDTVTLVDGNVGIGTTSPARKLHISLTGDNEAARFESNQSNTFIEIKDTNTTNNILLGSTGQDFVLHTGGSEQLRVSSSGNVGIGTTSPTSTLDITDDGGSGTTSFQVNSKIKISGDGVYKWGSSQNQGLLSWDTGKAMIGGQASNDLELYANNAVKMIIKQSGNVGIGNSAPTKELTVEGSISASGDYYVEATKKIYFGNGDNTYLYESGNDVLKFYAGGTEAFVIDDGNKSHFPNGNVGIGNSAPTKELTVQGVISASGYLQINEQLFVGENADGSPEIRNGSHELVNISGSGNEFIEVKGSGSGYCAAGLKLDTVGPGNNRPSGVYMKSSKTNNSWYMGRLYNQNFWGVSYGDQPKSGTNGNFEHIATMQSASLKMHNNGRVAIGNTSVGSTQPLGKVEIMGGNEPLLYLTASSDYTVEFDRAGEEKFDLSHGSSGLYMRKANVLLTGWAQSHTFSVYDTAATEYARFDGNTKKIGFGGAFEPKHAVHISGSGTTELYVDGNVSGSSTSTGSFGSLKLDGAAVDFSGLPTSDPGIAGRLWNDSNTLKISAG